MNMRSVAPMKIAKIGYIIMSLIYCIGGILFILFPELSVNVICKSLGIAMIVFGCVKLVGYFSKDLFRLAFQYDLEFGILLIALGLIALTRLNYMINFIFIALGIAIFADGLFKIQIALDSKKFGIQTWWLLLSLAIITGIVGLLLVFRPAESVTVLTKLLGISLMAEGILSLSVAIMTVKIIKNQKPDIIEMQ